MTDLLLEPLEEVDEPVRQRRVALNSLLVIGLALGMMGLGLVLRDSTLNATVEYPDPQNGINAQIPANWLLTKQNDNPAGDFIFRAQDVGGRPFATTIQVSLMTIGPDASPRNVADNLITQNNTRLSGYRHLSTEDTIIGEDEALRVTYAYVEDEPNPYLETKPSTVEGIDVIVIRGNQAIIMTYRDADTTFDDNRFYFDNFLRTIEY
jgi:hypothetical protein